MTLMSMSEGTPVFKAGVAVAAPTDWRFYDTIYTERFMRTPKENAEGYKESSAFTRADKLHGTCCWCMAWQTIMCTSKIVRNMPNNWFNLENNLICKCIQTVIMEYMVAIPANTYTHG